MFIVVRFLQLFLMRHSFERGGWLGLASTSVSVQTLVVDVLLIDSSGLQKDYEDTLYLLWHWKHWAQLEMVTKHQLIFAWQEDHKDHPCCWCRSTASTIAGIPSCLGTYPWSSCQPKHVIQSEKGRESTSICLVIPFLTKACCSNL